MLLAVDGSPSADRATEFVAAYRGERSRLAPVVLNVQAPPVMLWPEAALDARAVEGVLLESGQTLADAAARRLADAGLRPQRAVRLGLPANGILREAEARGAELIVMGTRGHGVVHGFALGSVAMRVAHGGATPVCLVQPESKLPAELGRRLRVMLALDGSEPALRAAQNLAAWRDWLGELDVQIVHVQQPLTFLETVLPPHRDVIEQWSTREGDEATQAARSLLADAGIRHHLHLSIGNTSQEIALLAEETKSELLVLGTRGRGAAHHALIGSIALKAVAASGVPVLLVK
ncbi:MAG: universal stress protein [Pseudomonadota bacterium]|nr:universal stress protein [Pseudomonadota bacterium]